MLVGIGFDQAGVHCHALPAGETFFNTACDSRFKQMPQQLTFPKTPVSILGKGRMIWDAIIEVETAKPAIREVQMHLLAEPPFRPDAEAIAH